MSADTIRLLVVDDNEMVRSSLAIFIDSFDDFELAGEASDGEEALNLCQQVHPDVVLMDLVMPKMDGTSATRAIRTSFPDIHVVALTSFGDEELIRGVITAGASGCISKRSRIDKLAQAIRIAHSGKIFNLSCEE
jgi:NarL family two-component system response regulator LiaR